MTLAQHQPNIVPMHVVAANSRVRVREFIVWCLEVEILETHFKSIETNMFLRVDVEKHAISLKANLYQARIEPTRQAVAIALLSKDNMFFLCFR